MSNHDQERFENYLEIERYIEDLQAGRKGILPQGLTPEQAGIYRMVAQLRSAKPEDAAPRPEFVEELRATLQTELQELTVMQPEPAVARLEEVPPEVSSSRESVSLQEVAQGRGIPEKPLQEKLPPRRRSARAVSRRNILTGGAVAAASLALGAAAGAAFESDKASMPPQTAASPQQTPTPTASWKVPLVGTDTPSRWLRVVALEQLGNDAQAFRTESVVGFVVRNDEQSKQANDENVIAFSATCTHMGCIVQWQSGERKFLCPCHGGLFDEYGNPDRNSPLLYLRSLPRLNTKIGNDGYVYVEVPSVAE